MEVKVGSGSRLKCTTYFFLLQLRENTFRAQMLQHQDAELTNNSGDIVLEVVPLPEGMVGGSLEVLHPPLVHDVLEIPRNKHNSRLRPIALVNLVVLARRLDDLEPPPQILRGTIEPRKLFCGRCPLDESFSEIRCRIFGGNHVLLSGTIVVVVEASRALRLWVRWALNSHEAFPGP
jgi:hypothetical protein